MADIRDNRPKQASRRELVVKFAVAIVVAAGLLALLWSIWNGSAIFKLRAEFGAVTFFAGMAILPAFGMPLMPLLVLAGATYGTRAGLLGSIIALGLNLSLCYWLARSALRPWLESLLRRRRFTLPDLAGANAESLRFALAVKLTPGLPAAIKNYVLGLSRMPFPLYFGVSMLLGAAYATVLIVLGDSVLEHDSARALIAAVVVLVLAGALWRHRRGRSAS